MRNRFLVVAGSAAFAAGMFAQTPATKGDTKAPAPAKSAAPAAAPKAAAPAKAAAAVAKTPWGDPDLQGTWFVMADVPMERSAANANKEFLTDAEIAAADAAKGVAPGRNARNADSAQDVSGAYNAVFNSILRTGRRTSMIIDPPDGRIPVLGGAQGRGGRGGAGGGAAAGAGAGAGQGQGRGGAGGGQGGRGGAANLAGLGIAPGQNDNPETVAQSPRCLGVPMPFLPLNTAFAQGTVMQLVQGPKSVGIYMEDDHAGGGNRVIHMDKSPHPPLSMRFYLGDSRGHWEGNTLVVETTNFDNGVKGGGRGAFSGIDTAKFKMTERYTRTGPNDLRREITFEDPTVWSRPWTILIEMGKTADSKHMIFDSACHEGNYGMVGILSGARRDEAAAAAKK